MEHGSPFIKVSEKAYWLKLQFRTPPGSLGLHLIRQFLNEDWSFNEESTLRAKKAGCEVLIVRNCTVINFLVDLILSEQKSNLIKLSNIVPAVPGQLTPDQYERIGMAFAGWVRREAKKNGWHMTIITRDKALPLREIIKGNRTRVLFERYINGYPASGHPSDVRRLDLFICAILRYRTSIDFAELRAYLLIEEHWNQEQVSELFIRIETGRDILQANKELVDAPTEAWMARMRQ